MSQAEAGLVRAQVLLLSHGRAGLGWVFAVEPPFDALLTDASVPPFAGVRWHASLSDAAAPLQGAGHSLSRPLQMAQLEAWLDALREQAEAGVPVADAPAAPVHTATSLSRLRRWPPESLLRNDPRHARIAALLARRGLRIATVAKLSGAGEPACRAFIEQLRRHDLLTEEAGAPVVPARARAGAVVLRSLLQR